MHIVELTQAGLARAKAEGKVLGRPAKTTPAHKKAMIEGFAGGQSISDLSRLYAVSRSTNLTVVKPAPSKQ